MALKKFLKLKEYDTKKQSWNIRNEGRTTEKVKMWVNTINFSSSLEFPKLCLMAEARLISLSDMVLSACKGHIQKSYF